jgi:sarcosine oxidase
LVPAIAAVAIPERQVMIWTQPIRPELFTPGRFPVFNMEAPEGRFYGFPVCEDAGLMCEIPGFKLGKYRHRGERADPDHLDREIHPEDEAVLREGIRRYFPDADGPAIALRPCMFTNSPDEHFVLDSLPGCPEVLIAAGFSGHGYKFASVIGEIMADLATRGSSPLDLTLFRLARFAT